MKQTQTSFTDIAVSYHRNDVSSGALVLYNLTYHTIHDMEIIIENEHHDSFTLEISCIPYKTGALLDYKNVPDKNGKVLTKEIKSIKLIYGDQSRYFISEKKGFRQK